MPSAENQHDTHFLRGDALKVDGVELEVKGDSIDTLCVVSRTSPKLLQISAIDFLNPAPLMWDFEHEPGYSQLASRYQVHKTMPSQCAVELSKGSADIGLVPIAAYATIPDLLIVPGCMVGAIGPIRSLLLIRRANQPLEEIRTVSADTSSRATFSYTQILFKKYWNAKTEFIPHSPDLDAMLKTADAALLIGDPALYALEDQTEREKRTGERLVYHDLAHEWQLKTGFPWISAIWAMRSDRLQTAGYERDLIAEDFLRSRDNGIEHVEDLVSEWSKRIAVPASTIRTYLTQNIHYVLNDECIAGMELFYRYAAECNVLPPISGLRFL